VAYATQGDLLQRMTLQELIQLTDDSRPPTTVNATVVANEIAEGSAVVDSYCRNRYIVPLQPSVDVTRIVRDVVVYQLYSRRPANKMPEVARQRYEDVMALLKDIAIGKASLDQPCGAPAQTTADGGTLPSRNEERMTNRNLEGYC